MQNLLSDFSRFIDIGLSLVLWVDFRLRFVASGFVWAFHTFDFWFISTE